MSKVSVLDTNKTVLEPCPPAQARRLLKSGEAAVWRRYPFTIILKSAVTKPVTTEYQLCIDPGSKVTGLAIVDINRNIVFAADLEHRGQMIKKSLTVRSGFRRGRRTRKIRYRQPRWQNRKRAVPTLGDNGWSMVREGKDGKGWIAPSLMSRVYNIYTWTARLTNLYPITSVTYESVKFDTQLINNPDISGVEYQQGDLWGYEVKEYLLHKHEHKCAYCGKKDMPLQVDHIYPKSHGGSNRVDNLAIACKPCNQRKGNTIPDNIEDDRMRRSVKRVQSGKGINMLDMSVVNTIRWKIHDTLKSFGLPVIQGTGGKTKYNRTKSGLPKTHYYDAACVSSIVNAHEHLPVLNIKAKGYGQRDLFQFSAGENKNKIRLVGKKNAKKKPHGFIFGDRKRTSADGFEKFDHVRMVKSNGKSYTGIINCFNATFTKSGHRQLMIESSDVKVASGRTSGSSPELELLCRRDGYYYTICA